MPVLLFTFNSQSKSTCHLKRKSVLNIFHFLLQLQCVDRLIFGCFLRNLQRAATCKWWSNISSFGCDKVCKHGPWAWPCGKRQTLQLLQQWCQSVIPEPEIPRLLGHFLEFPGMRGREWKNYTPMSPSLSLQRAVLHKDHLFYAIPAHCAMQ